MISPDQTTKAQQIPEINHALKTNSYEPSTEPHLLAPQSIALLLPGSGPYLAMAQNILQGFLLSYYQMPAGNRPSIDVFDSSSADTLSSAYQIIAKNNYDFVIGPLQKKQVEAWLKLSEGLYPTLTLNYAESDHGATESIFQFGLLPEDDIDMLTEHANRKGYKAAAIITVDNTWGKRMHAAFVQSWNSYNGVVSAHAMISDESHASKMVANLLAVDKSQIRAKQLKKILSTKLHSTPRRRQDIDVIFLATPPELAQQIRPLIDFHYGQHIPIFASSHVFDANIDIQKAPDLNEVIFTDLPWVAAPNTKFLPQLKDLAQQNSGFNLRLFALGYDAGNIIPKLHSLKQNHHFVHFGATGKLSLNLNGRIHRKMPLLHVHNHAIELL